VEGNAALRASAERLQAMSREAERADALPDPTVAMGLFPVPVETATGPQQGKVSLTQRLPWFGKRALDAEAAEAAAELAEARYRGQRSELLYGIRSLWVRKYVLNRKIHWTRSFLELARRQEQLQLRRYSSGQGLHPDLIDIQLERLALEDRLQRLRAGLPGIDAEFRAYLNSEGGEDPPSADSLVPVFSLADPLETAEALRRGNPGLQAAAAAAEMSASVAEKSNLNRYPDLNVGLDYIIGGKKSMNGQPVEGSGQDPIMVMVGLQVPLHWKRLRDRADSAVLFHREKQALQQDTENRLLAELEARYSELGSALQSVRLYQEALLPRSEELLNASEKAYIAEENDYFRFLEAQRRLFRYRMEFEELLGQVYLLYAGIDKLTGVEK